MNEVSLERVFVLMLGCMTAADASRRQVNGILTWRERVMHATALARDLGSAAGTQAPAVPSTTHRAWMGACDAITAALLAQAAAAEVIRHRATAEAEAADTEADSETARAAKNDAIAAHEEAAARDCDRRRDGDPDGRHAAGAHAHRAAALAAHAAATEARAAAQTAATRAKTCRQRAAKAATWEIAAREAEGHGRRLMADEDAIAVPVGDAIAHAGGIREVPGVKWYLRGAPALGGAR